MDQSPIDIETLARLANEIFKADLGGDNGVPKPVPGTPNIPYIQGTDDLSSNFANPGATIPAGGATFSPASPPTRPTPGLPPDFNQPFDLFASNFAGPQAPGGISPVLTGPGALMLPSTAPFNLKDSVHFGESFPEEAELRALLMPRDGSFPSGGRAVPGGPSLPPASPGVGQAQAFGYPDPFAAASPAIAAPATAGSAPHGVSAPGFSPPAHSVPGLPASGSALTPSQAPNFYFIDEGYFADDVPKLPKSAGTLFNAGAVRSDFPIFKQRINGYPLIWLDNGATTQKPQTVIDRIAAFYANENSNIHRGAHTLAARATDAYEDARKTVQRFINAPSVEEIVFLRGTTEGINFVAQSFGRRFIGENDEIIVTHFEHHANIVPWYLLAKETGAKLRVAPVDDNGELLLDEYEKLINGRTKIVSITHVSNALGTVLPAKAMIEIAHRHGVPVLLDGAQSISHMPIDVQDLDCDFFVFSGHKVFAPTGIGAVYGKKPLLDSMPPWQGGGNMIKDVTFEKIAFQPAPFRFEAGTGNIADAVGLGEALKYIERIGMTNIAQHEHAVLDYALARLKEIKGLRIIGNAKERAGVISLLLDGLEPGEVGKALNQKGIAVRAGHHCALPILRRFGVEATVRPSFALYNTFEEADRLTDALREISVNGR
jgi:cysteine desulfurase/selenocysteine lyase